MTGPPRSSARLIRPTCGPSSRELAGGGVAGAAGFGSAAVTGAALFGATAGLTDVEVGGAEAARASALRRRAAGAVPDATGVAADAGVSLPLGPLVRSQWVMPL